MECLQDGDFVNYGLKAGSVHLTNHEKKDTVMRASRYPVVAVNGSAGMCGQSVVLYLVQTC